MWDFTSFFLFSGERERESERDMKYGRVMKGEKSGNLPVVFVLELEFIILLFF